MTAPVTGFEQRGQVAPWTSLAEGNTFLDALEAHSPRVTTEVIGQGAGGASIRLVTVAHPTTPATRTVLYVAQQHGAELAGREAILTRLRDWAVSPDPALLDYLATTTVLVIPTAHPDNTTVRENPAGINVNRDHLNLTQPESQSIQAVIRDHRPSMVIDLHEGQNITADFATSWPQNPNADQQVIDLSVTLDGVVQAAITGEGHTWEAYQANNIHGPEYLQNAAALRHAVSVLLESRRVAGNETDAAARYSLHLTAIDAIMAWHQANRAAVETATAGARTRAATRGAAKAPFELVVETNSSGPLLSPAPAGYRLTTAQYNALAVHRDRFQIATVPDGADRLVPMTQAAQTLIPYLIAPTSPIKVVSAVPVAGSLPTPPTDVLYRFGVGGQTVVPVAIKFGIGQVALLPAPPPTAASVDTEARTSVSQHGVTFTFDQPYLTGQFVSGDWWAIPAAPGETVTVTGVTPDYEVATTKHGWMVNPSSMTQSSYDGRLNADGALRAIQGWAPGLLPQLPLALTGGSSVVKAVSAPLPRATSATGHVSPLQTAVVFTVLDTQPAVDAFRPPYYGSSKPLFAFGDVVQGNLPSLAPPAITPPSLEWIASRFARVQLDHYFEYNSRYMHPIDNIRDGYGASMAQDHNDAILRLMLNDKTWAEKKAALVAVLQAGIDWYGTAAAGGKWLPNGGHLVGRKQMVTFAAVMFDDPAMKTVAGNTAWDSFSEVGHVYAAPQRALYGRPEVNAGDYWAKFETGNGKRDLRDPTGQIDGGDSPGYAYQNIVSGTFSEAALIARRLPGGMAVWNHPAFFEYVDRWRNHGTWAQPDTESARRPLAAARHGVRGPESYRSAFGAAMWDKHR